jgi:hypothetical protein
VAITEAVTNIVNADVLFPLPSPPNLLTLDAK